MGNFEVLKVSMHDPLAASRLLLFLERLCQVKLLVKSKIEALVSTRNLCSISGPGRKKKFGVRTGYHWDGHLFIEVVVGRLGFLLVCLLSVSLLLVGLLLMGDLLVVLPLVGLLLVGLLVAF